MKTYIHRETFLSMFIADLGAYMSPKLEAEKQPKCSLTGDARTNGTPMKFYITWHKKELILIYTTILMRILRGHYTE